jgi:hypothetical protein
LALRPFHDKRVALPILGVTLVATLLLLVLRR